MGKPSLLLITDESPELIGGGALVYINALLNCLTAHFQVSVMVCDPNYASKHTRLIQDKAYEKFQPGFFQIGRRSLSLKGLLNKLLKRKVKPNTQEFSAAQKQTLITQAANARKWDHVLMNYYWLCPFLELFPRSYKSVVTHDVWHKHVSFSSGANTAMTAQEESAYLDNADLIIAISKKDAGDFKAMLPKKDVVVVHPVIQAKGEAATLEDAHYGIVFIASSYSPNIQGLKWLSEKVCPLLPQHDERYTIHVLGTICKTVEDEALHKLIKLEGGFYDVSRIYSQSAISIAPILEGTGVKIKVVEAVAYAHPVAVTPKAIEGIEFLKDYGVLIGDDAESFAKNLIELIENKPCREEARALNLKATQKYFSQEAAGTELIGILTTKGQRS